MDQRLKVSLASQRIPKNSTDKLSESQLHYIKLLSHFRLPILSDWRSIYSEESVGFTVGEIIFKKEKRKERKAESGHRPAPVYVQYTLQPNARLLHPTVKVAPSPVARDATLSAQLTPLCACVRVVPA